MTDFRPEKGELEKAQQLVQEGIEKASEILIKNEDLKSGFGWTEDPFVLDNMNGVSGKSFGSQYIHIQFNTEAPGWKNAVRANAVHEYAHAWFYEQIENDHAKILWRYIIDEALTQNLAEKLVPEYKPEWRTKHSKDTISDYWPEIKSNLEREVNHPDPLYINQKEGGYPNWLGYSLSYLIGKKLLESHNPEDFPELAKKDIIKAGNELFGEKE